MNDLLFFLSYAHDDDKYKRSFVEAINPALKGKNWRLWQDGEIMPGANWDDNIRKNLTDAHVIILLVSNEFLNSEYVIDVELRESLERHKKGTALVIPVILDGCLWEETDLKGIQAVVINEKIKKDPKAALQDAARKILDSVKAYQPGRAVATALKPEEISELRQPDPDALIVAVRQKKDIFLLQPRSGNVSQHPLSGEGLPQRVVGILQRLLLKGDLEEEDCRVLGEALFQRLFADTAARDYFIKTYQNCLPADGKPLKIVLHFDDQSSDLAGLPWEYLWLPLTEGAGEGFFIGEKENLVLTRRLSSGGKGKKVEADKLRILVAYSKPQIQEMAQRIEDDAKSVFGRSQPLKEEDKKQWVNIEIAGPQEFKSQAEFEAYIQKEKPFHIVHFVGKGKTENGSGLIAFCNAAAKKEDWLAPDAFVKCFPDGKKPNLIFLHAPPDSCRSLRDMALNLVTSVDGIVAIQTPVKSEEAADFSEKLYTALALGEYLDEAVTHAARYAAAKSANRLRMYGISASFSRSTLKMEVAKPAPASQPYAGEVPEVYVSCPDWDTYEKNCPGKIGVKGNRPTRLNCPVCKIGPLWLCPQCSNLLDLKNDTECRRCGFRKSDLDQKDMPDYIKTILQNPSDPHKEIKAPQSETNQAHNKPDTPPTQRPASASSLDTLAPSKGVTPPPGPVQL